jgi:hypothetical protein
MDLKDSDGARNEEIKKVIGMRHLVGIFKPTFCMWYCYSIYMETRGN